MPQLLTVAHDYICPWCWVGRRQAERLRAEFPGLELTWRGFELLPEGLPYTPAPPDPDADRKPKTPTRFELILAADGLTLPARKSALSNSRLALEGAEFARIEGMEEAYHDAVYHAYWEEDRNIADRGVLEAAAATAGLNVSAFNAALDTRQYRNSVVEYDDPAHAAGIWNVPTWMFPEAWIAEQPYSVVREFAARFTAAASSTG